MSTDRINTPPPTPTGMENEEMEGHHVNMDEDDDSIHNIETGEIHFSGSFELDGDHSPVPTQLFGQDFEYHNENVNEEDVSDEQDENWSVIRMDENVERNMFGSPPSFNFDRWVWASDDAEQESRRRVTALREIEQTQRSNFLHFVLLCLVPTSLLLILVVTVMGNDDECIGMHTYCYSEPKSFFNPFTSRCICDAAAL